MKIILLCVLFAQIPPATQTRKDTEQRIKDKFAEEKARLLKEAMTSIDEAIKRGHFETDVVVSYRDERLVNLLKKELIADGYAVTSITREKTYFIPQRGPQQVQTSKLPIPYLNISWRNRPDKVKLTEQAAKEIFNTQKADLLVDTRNAMKNAVRYGQYRTWVQVTDYQVKVYELVQKELIEAGYEVDLISRGGINTLRIKWGEE